MTAQVCSSVRAIRSQIESLSSKPVSSKTPEELKSAIKVAEAEEAKIKEVSDKLPEASRAPVESAQRELQEKLVKVAASLVSTAVSSGDLEAVVKKAEPEIKSAISGLATSYKQAYDH